MPVTKADGADWGGGKGGGGLGGGNDDTAMSPGRAQAQFGTAALAGYSPNQAAQMIANMGGGGEGAAQINQSLLAGAKREAIRAEEARRAAVQGLGGSAGGYSLYQGILQDALNAAERKLAASKAYTPSPLSYLDVGTNLGNRYMQQKFVDMLGDRIGPRGSEAYQSYLDAPRLARPVFDSQGQITGVYDEYGRLTGRDPARDERERRMQEGEGGAQQVVAPSPVTGQCPDGYIFDEDLQACRLDTGVAERVDYTAPQTYGMMGLLDTAPSGLLEFGQRFRLPPVDFAASNQAFRRASGTITPYQGYTLL